MLIATSAYNLLIRAAARATERPGARGALPGPLQRAPGALPMPLARPGEHEALHLARGGLRQLLLRHVEGVRDLVDGGPGGALLDLRAHERAHLLLAERLSLLLLHGGQDLGVGVDDGVRILAAVLVELADHHHLGEQRAGGEEVLDLLGIDVLPALGDDDVLQPAGDVQVAVGVQLPDVPRVQPALRVDDLARLLRACRSTRA